MKRVVIVARYYLTVALAVAVCLLITMPVWASTINFAPAQSYPVGQNPFSVTGADFNGDGKADIAAAILNSSTSSTTGFLDDVAVLLNNGDGTFGAAQHYKVGEAPTSVSSADFNSDGNADLAVANRCGLRASELYWCNGNVSVLLGNGDGAFEAARFAAVGAGNILQSVTSDDFDDDGHQDLAVTIRNNAAGTTANSILPSNEIAVLLGNGDGTFGAPAFLEAGTGPYSVTSADLSNDGKADLAVANADSNNVSVLLGNGDGTFGTTQNFDVGNQASSVTSADFNEDGKKDLAVAAYLSGARVLLGNGDGTFGAAQTVGFDRAFAVSSSDFDGDGNLDLAAAGVGTEQLSVVLGNGDGTFLTPQTFLVTPDVRSLNSADFNGDQKPDLAVANNSSSSVSVLLNAPCTKTGTSGDDVLNGTSGDDIICGGGGKDTINGLGGNDVLKGEVGADNLSGGAGNDTLDGGTGTDIANFSGSPAAITASLINPTTASGEGSDILTDIEDLIGSSKNDTLTGSMGNNTINGGAGADTLQGLYGDDVLTGADGGDTERGGWGNDTVIGGGGADNLFGEGDDDTVNSKDGVKRNDSLDGGTHVNGDTAIKDAKENSIVGFP